MADPPNHFFKFIPPGFQFNLSIPKSFLTKLGDGWRGKKAILRRGGHKWVVHIGDGGVFGDGWRKFVMENRVEEFDIIVFKHQGNMVFDFFVFDPSGCERQYPNISPDDVEAPLPKSDPLHTDKRSKMLTKRKRTDYASQSKEELDDDRCFVTTMTSYIISTSRLNVPMKFARSNGLTSKRMHTPIVLVDEAKRTWPAKLYINNKTDQICLSGWRELIIKEDLKVGDACMFELVKEGKVPVFNFYNLGKKPTNKHIHVNNETSSTIQNVTSSTRYFISTIKRYSSERSCLYLPVEFSRQNRLRMGEMFLRDDKGRSWRVELREHNKRRLYIGRGFREFWDANGLMEGDAYKFELAENENENDKPPIVNFLNLGKKPTNKETLVKKQTSSTIRKATSSTSSTRYFISTLKPCSSGRSFLYLPVQFSISNDLRTGEMILRDDKGRSWIVQLNKNGNNRFYIGRGLRDFWVANGLTEGDAYKFELVENEKGMPHVVNFSYLGKKAVKNHIQSQETSLSIKKVIGSTMVQKEERKLPITKVNVDSSPSEIEDFPSYFGEVKSYCLEKSMLYLPNKFALKNGLFNKEKMLLKNMDERSWTVDIKRTGHYCYIGRGWKEFCGENGLKVGNLFKLELVSNGEIPVAKFYVQKVH